MKKHTVLTLVFATFALLTSKAQSMKLSTTLPVEGTIVKASDPNIQYMGRVRMEGDKAMFNFPGVTILSNFEGTSIKMLCRPKTGYFMVTIDDSKPFKVGFNAQRDSLVTLAVALPQGKHTVRAMYCMEGLFTHPEFKGFVLDEGARLLTSKYYYLIYTLFRNCISNCCSVSSRTHKPILSALPAPLPLGRSLSRLW